MKSGVKGFWKKQKNVIRRHKPSNYVSHRPGICIDFSKIDSGLFPSVSVVNVDDIRQAISVEVKIGEENPSSN